MTYDLLGGNGLENEFMGLEDLAWDCFVTWHIRTPEGTSRLRDARNPVCLFGFLHPLFAVRIYILIIIL